MPLNNKEACQESGTSKQVVSSTNSHADLNYKACPVAVIYDAFRFGFAK